MDDKLIQMARECGIRTFGMTMSNADKVGDLLAAFRSAILADAAKDVEPVATVTVYANNGYASDYRLTWHRPMQEGTYSHYSASTLAAAQALNAELVARVEGLEKDAARWQLWRSGVRLTVVVPTPTDKKPDKKVTIIFGPNEEPNYPEELDKAADAALAARSGT